MHVQRSVTILAVLTTLAPIAACGAYAHHNRSEPTPEYSTVAVQWDSGPLDAAYNRERTDMNTRHGDENANPRTDESRDVRANRQSTENQDLERRYAEGKKSHARDLAPADHSSHDDKQSDKSRQ